MGVRDRLERIVAWFGFGVDDDDYYEDEVDRRALAKDGRLLRRADLRLGRPDTDRREPGLPPDAAQRRGLGRGAQAPRRTGVLQPALGPLERVGIIGAGKIGGSLVARLSTTEG